MLSKFILKYENKAIFLIGGFIILALAIMLIVMFSNTGEKTPVTCEQLNTKLIDMGYEPADTTYAYSDQNANLIRSIAIDTGKIRFDFFEFDNDDGAANAYNSACNQMLDYRSRYNVSHSQGYANYYMHSLISSGVYYITIRVGNTALYAYCDEDYMDELGKILSKIGYTDNSDKDK